VQPRDQNDPKIWKEQSQNQICGQRGLPQFGWLGLGAGCWYVLVIFGSQLGMGCMLKPGIPGIVWCWKSGNVYFINFIYGFHGCPYGLAVRSL